MTFVMQNYLKYSNTHTMYRIILLFVFFCPNISAQFTENWNDNSFTTPPVWSGQLDKYNINTSQQKLLLNAPSETSEAYLSTSSEAIGDATWEFSVYMDFNPSSTNYALIFLSSNQIAYNENLEGYYVMVGNTDDEVSLWKREAGSNVKIIDGRDKILDSPSVSVTIKVERDNGGNWHLQTKLPGQSYVTEGKVEDNFMASSKYFGIYCRYTSTRSDKFSFGPITVSGNAFVDKDKPRIRSHQLISGNQFDIVFSENLHPASVSVDNFIAEPGAIHPNRFTLTDNRVTIYFNDYLADTNYGNLTIKGVEDESGNAIKDTSLTYSFKRIKLLRARIANPNSLQLIFSKPLDASVIDMNVIETELNFDPPALVNDTTLLFTSVLALVPNQAYALKLSKIPAAFGDIVKDTTIQIIYRPAERFDIVFTEFMPDPSPNVGLFDAEYIELYNRRDYTINLEGMKLIINDKETILPNYELAPNAYVLIINENYLADLPKSLPVLGLKSMPALTNSSGTLILYHANNTVSDVIQYPLEIEEGGFKEEGGWAFERIDLNNHQADNNWAYSINLEGGTPGSVNSVSAANPDATAPHVRYLSFIDAQTFQIVFSEALKDTESFDPSMMHVDGAVVSSIIAEPIFLNSLRVSFAENLPVGQIFKANFTQPLNDFAGNALNNNESDKKHALRLGVPEMMDSFNVCVNEVLFNPKPEDVDFVEIFNRSDKILNRSDIYLSSLLNPSFGDLVPDALTQIDDKNRLLFPNDYLVVTSNVKITGSVHANVDEELVSQSNLPSMSDDEGSIVIAKNNGEIIDYFVYNSNMHFELLRNKEGVSLERISPNASTNTAHNWHSASQQSNYATPTLQNSQYSAYVPRETKSWLTLEKEEFSPNADGTDDFMQINYFLRESGWTGNVIIYNRYGYPVKTIANNELLGVQGFFTWDGTTDSNQQCAMGIYLVYANFFSLTGERKQQKLTVVLNAGRKR